MSSMAVRWIRQMRAPKLIAALLLASAAGCAARAEHDDGAASQDQGVSALPADYEQKTALQKQALLFRNIASDEYCSEVPSAAGASPYDLSALRGWAPPEDDRAYYPDVALPAGLATPVSEATYLSAACRSALGSGATPGVSTAQSVRALFAQSSAFDHSADEIDAPRHKIIHVTGSAAAVAFQTVNGATRGGFGQGEWLRYTGLLGARQQIPGILRIGEAGVPLGDTIFGLALKLFVDGQPSRNIHGMTRINGQASNRQPFQLPITNMLLWNEGTNRGIVAVLKALQFVKPDSLQVPVDHFARVTPDGRDLLEGVSYPHELSFVPEKRVADVVHALLAANPEMDLRQAFRAIPVGTVLYRVTARRNGPGGICNDFVEIGRIVLVSPLVASAYEDRTLFFRHNRGKWREEQGRRVPWTAGDGESGTEDVNEENRTAVTQDCTN